MTAPDPAVVRPLLAVAHMVLAECERAGVVISDAPDAAEARVAAVYEAALREARERAARQDGGG